MPGRLVRGIVQALPGERAIIGGRPGAFLRLCSKRATLAAAGTRIMEMRSLDYASSLETNQQTDLPARHWHGASPGCYAEEVDREYFGPQA